MRIDATDSRLTWSGAIDVEQGDGWVKPWRVPHDDLDLYSPGDPALAVRAEMPSGVRLRFETDAGWLTLETEPLIELSNVGAGPSPKKFDLFVGEALVAQSESADGATSVRLDGLPQGQDGGGLAPAGHRRRSPQYRVAGWL